ncbi:MAG TPA: triose-phosphate isomerase [Chroococcales cyanobacterium]
MTNSHRKTIIAGNWKMHKTRGPARELSHAIVSGVKSESDKQDLPVIVVCPPFTSLQETHDALRGSHVHLGAQNMDYRESGAFTGEISPTMLTELGVKYVIIGHSERRQFFGETNSTVNLKLKAALAHKLIPIVCVGESLDEREANLTDAVVRRQVGAALADLEDDQLETLIIAYEPVWAIGTGKNCEAPEANRVAALIRSTINDHFGTPSGQGLKGDGSRHALGDIVPILYGGSVKPSTIEEQMEQPDLDGALVGGASLKSEEFLPIIEGAKKRVRLSCSKV